MRHEPPPARALNPSVPADLDCIVRQALRPEPQERYGSVEALRADLLAFLESRPVQARPGNVWYHGRRFARRHWVPLGAATLVVISLAAALVVVERARANADRRFGQLQQLATRVLDLDRDIRDLSGSTAARHELVSISLEYLEGLAADARNDLDLARQLGVAYHRVARVQGVPVSTNLGQWRAAEASLKKADALMTSVLASRPNDRAARYESAGIAHDLMVVTESERHGTDALAWARTAIARIERLIASGDVTGDQRRQLTRYEANVALALVNMHRYAEAIPVVGRVVEAARSDPRSGGQLASGLSLLATALRYQGHLDGALRAVREARAIAEHTATSGLTERMFVLYGPLLREGMILGEEGGVNLGRPGEAVEPFQRALDVTEVVAKADPNDSTSRARVGTSARQLANIVRATDPRGAAAIYDVALKRLREIPKNVGARRSEAMTLAESCYTLRAIGRRAEASRRMARALGLLGEPETIRVRP